MGMPRRMPLSKVTDNEKYSAWRVRMTMYVHFRQTKAMLGELLSECSITRDSLIYVCFKIHKEIAKGPCLCFTLGERYISCNDFLVLQ